MMLLATHGSQSVLSGTSSSASIRTSGRPSPDDVRRMVVLLNSPLIRTHQWLYIETPVERKTYELGVSNHSLLYYFARRSIGSLIVFASPMIIYNSIRNCWFGTERMKMRQFKRFVRFIWNSPEFAVDDLSQCDLRDQFAHNSCISKWIWILCKSQLAWLSIKILQSSRHFIDNFNRWQRKWIFEHSNLSAQLISSIFVGANKLLLLQLRWESGDGSKPFLLAISDKLLSL